MGGDGEAFRHDLSVQIDVAAGIEEDLDDGDALDRCRDQFLNSRYAVDLGLDRRGDQHLDLFRRQALCFRLDTDLGRGELRKNIVFSAKQTEDAVAEQHAAERDDHAAEADGECDDGRLQAGGARVSVRGHF